MLFFRYLETEPFADIHRVKGVKGIYIANVLNKPPSKENLATVITFDKGGTWEFLLAPGYSSYTDTTHCPVSSGLGPVLYISMSV